MREDGRVGGDTSRDARTHPPQFSWVLAMAIALAASVLLVVVALPRFGALNEPSHDVLEPYRTVDGTLLRATTIDMREYLAAVEYHAGDAPPPDIAPFTRRLGVTWAAGRLPLPAPIALNLVVVGVLCAGACALVALQRRLGLSARVVAASAVVYSVSFPVFYWGSFNYVDGAIVGILAVLLYSMVIRRPELAVVLVGVGVIAKESAFVGTIALLVWINLGAMSGKRRGVWSALTVFSTVAGYALAVSLAPSSTSTYNPWLPAPTEVVGYVGHNLRPGTVAQVVLTVALPATGVALAVFRRHAVRERCGRQLYWTLWAGTGAGALLAVQSLLTAQLDGRTVWTAYPFALTLGAMALESGRADSSAPGASSAAPMASVERGDV